MHKKIVKALEKLFNDWDENVLAHYIDGMQKALEKLSGWGEQNELWF